MLRGILLKACTSFLLRFHRRSFPRGIEKFQASFVPAVGLGLEGGVIKISGGFRVSISLWRTTVDT